MRRQVCWRTKLCFFGIEGFFKDEGGRGSLPMVQLVRLWGYEEG